MRMYRLQYIDPDGFSKISIYSNRKYKMSSHSYQIRNTIREYVTDWVGEYFLRLSKNKRTFNDMRFSNIRNTLCYRITWSMSKYRIPFARTDDDIKQTIYRRGEDILDSLPSLTCIREIIQDTAVSGLSFNDVESW